MTTEGHSEPYVMAFDITHAIFC